MSLTGCCVGKCSRKNRSAIPLRWRKNAKRFVTCFSILKKRQTVFSGRDEFDGYRPGAAISQNGILRRHSNAIITPAECVAQENEGAAIGKGDSVTGRIHRSATAWQFKVPSLREMRSCPP